MEGDALQSVTLLSGQQPPQAELEVLRLLAQGLTQKAIARRLGCSERTIRRRIDDAYARLGAAGPFQAGHLATMRKWI